MRKIIIAFLLIVTIFGVQALENELSAVIKSLPGAPSQSISVGGITYAGSKLGTPFSSYLTDILEDVILKQGGFELVDQYAREAVMDEMMLALSGLSDSRNEIGELTQIEIMIDGRFYQSGGEIILSLDFLDMKTSRIIKNAVINIPDSDLPLGLQILPDNYANAQLVLEELSKVSNTGDGKLEIRAWTNKGESGVFKDGEKMVINFFANQSCFIKIYSINAEGEMSLIFPNLFCLDNKIEGGKLYKIPDKSYGFEFLMGPPYGVEFIRAEASTAQFSFEEEAFESLGQMSAEALARGISVKKTDALRAETQISYTIIR